ncbi:MAG: cyclase family protein [Chloroflexota bacterium]
MKPIDLSQNWDMHTPGFAGYEGPTIKWTKRLAFDKAGGQHISSTLHVGTHLDAPLHFQTNGDDIASIPIEELVGPACIVDLTRYDIGDYQLYGPEHFEQWERDTGIEIQADDILVIHTGYHRHYPSNWEASCAPEEPDDTRYFIKHPGPTREFAQWVLDRGIRWIAVDCGSADHPMNTVIRRIRPDLAAHAEAALGRPLDELWPEEDYQIMHTLLFPHGVVHIENAGGQIDRLLDQRVQVGCFPWRFSGGEAAFCRFVAFMEE